MSYAIHTPDDELVGFLLCVYEGEYLNLNAPCCTFMPQVWEGKSWMSVSFVQFLSKVVLSPQQPHYASCCWFPLPPSQRGHRM